MIIAGTHATDILERREEASEQFFVERAWVQGVGEDNDVDRVLASKSTESRDDFVATVGGGDILEGSRGTKEEGEK